MGLCKYCLQPAGLFRWQHRACAERRQQALSKINSALAEVLNDKTSADELWGHLEFTASDGFINKQELQSLVKAALVAAVKRASADHLLSQEEDNRFGELCQAFDFSANELGSSAQTLFKAQVLRGLNEGEIAEVDLESGVLLKPDEQAVWEFGDTRYLTTQTHVQYVGGSQGVSVRLAKGLYYRASAFHGEPIRAEEMTEVGIGALVVTTSGLIFDSPGNSYSPGMASRWPFKKIIAVHRFSNAIEVLSEVGHKRPAIFQVDDPHFAVNLLVATYTM